MHTHMMMTPDNFSATAGAEIRHAMHAEEGAAAHRIAPWLATSTLVSQWLEGHLGVVTSPTEAVEIESGGTVRLSLGQVFTLLDVMGDGLILIGLSGVQYVIDSADAKAVGVSAMRPNDTWLGSLLTLEPGVHAAFSDALRAAQNLSHLHDTMRHDVGVMLQAFTGGAIRHGWQSQFDDVTPDLAQVFAQADVSWPQTHAEACGIVLGFRLAQVNQGDGSRMLAELWQGVAPGTWTPEPQCVSALVPHGWMYGAEAVTPEAVTEWADSKVTAWRYALDAFSAVWDEAWNALDDAAQRYAWCSEYEQTSDAILSATLTPGITRGAARTRDYTVTLEVPVTVTVTTSVTVSLDVEAGSESEARDASLDIVGEYLSTDRVTEALNYGYWTVEDWDADTYDSECVEVSEA